MINEIIVLCGGLGTRFNEVRNDIPKIMAPINGEPFIKILLDYLVKHHFTRIILATGHLSNVIEQYIKKGTMQNILFQEINNLVQVVQYAMH